MPSLYTLSSSQLQTLQAGAQRFNAYVAFFNPVSFTSYIQDLDYSSVQTPIPPTIDLLNLGVPPFHPAAIMGPNRIGFVNEPLYFDGSRSTQRHNILAWGHSWSATGSPTATYYSTPVSFSDSLSAGLGVTFGNQQAAFTWSQPGLYIVRLTIKDRYGNSNTGFRQVMIYASRSQAQQGIIAISNLTGSIDQGGWSCTVQAIVPPSGAITADQLAVGSYLPIAIMIETEYDSATATAQPITIAPNTPFIPGQPYDDARIIFAGYVKTETCDYDDAHSTLTFDCQTPDLVLQEANVLNVAYYNATWNTKNSAGQWNSQAAILPNSDQLVADLTMPDIYRSLLCDHCLVGNFHDVFFWWEWLPDPSLPGYVSQATYTSITVNQGTIWAGIQACAQNEFASQWCDYDGSIRIGPTINYRGSASWGWYHNAPAATRLSLTSNYTGNYEGVWPSDATRPATNVAYNTQFPATYQVTGATVTHPGTIYQQPYAGPHISYIDAWRVYNWRNEFFPTLVPGTTSGQTVYGALATPPKNPVWLPVVNVLWGAQSYPQARSLATAPDRDPSQALILPILAHLADGPIYDPLTQQDLSLRPWTVEVVDTYTTRSTFVKLIGYKVQHDSAWASFYPTTTFTNSGNTREILPVGAFTLYDSLVVPDMTAKSASVMAWAYLWNLARLIWYQMNARYTASIVIGLVQGWRLHDLLYVTRQAAQKGPQFYQKLFYINQISVNIDVNARAWQTTLQLNEVTSNAAALQVPIVPPTAPPA